MSEESPNDPTVDVKTDIPEKDDFNRTVIISAPEVKSGNSDSTPLKKIVTPFFKKKQEIEEIIGGMNITPYTNSQLDTSADLESPLNNLDTKYSVLEQFATGGTSTVSIAQDRNLRRVVAIKSLKKEAENNPELLQSFVSEAKVTAQLDHPGIIPIYGLSSDDENGIHLAMKLVNGKTLRDYLRNITLNYRIRGIDAFDEDMMLQKRLEIFLRVCDAIAYAHHRNVMHRDIKPENIMIGKYMEVFVMDWGLAKIIPEPNAPLPPKTHLSGTPRYFPPEVLRGERVDARSDIFTLGLILQEVVTLQFAIQGKDEKERMEHILNGEIAPIEHLFHRKIDKSLQAIIKKATAYWPADRYQSVDSLAEDLRCYIGGRAVSARPDNLWMKFSRYVMRHRLECLSYFMLLLLLFATITAYSVYRQLTATQNINKQRIAMNYSYNRVASVARHLDITALGIQDQLAALSRIVGSLLTFNTNAPFPNPQYIFLPPMDKIKNMAPGTLYSPFYKRMVNMDCGIVTPAPNSEEESCKEFLRLTAPALAKMKEIVLGSNADYTYAQDDYDKLKTEYLYKGTPVRSVFIGSSTGIKMLYPWRGNYSRKIDPRERAWYKNALTQEGAVWGRPYMDQDSISGLSIPCSVKIYDMNGNFSGVASLDLSINQLTRQIISRGNTGPYVKEKAIIDLQGHTIVSTQSEFFNKTFDPDKYQYHQEASFETPLFRDQNIRERILKRGRDYNTFIIEEKGSKTLYSFAYLEVFKMFYVVVADYQQLLDLVDDLQQNR